MNYMQFIHDLMIEQYLLGMHRGDNPIDKSEEKKSLSKTDIKEECSKNKKGQRP